MQRIGFWSRRRVLAAAIAGAASLPVLRTAFAGRSANALPPIAGERWLELHSTHTSERVTVAYRNSQGLVSASVDKLAHLLRDHRRNEVHAIDPALFDQMADLALAAGREARFDIISGYRSPATNASLAASRRGVATRSLHMSGKAIDLRLRGTSVERVRDLALAMGRGGVGYYRRSNFVHIDTGRVRRWQG